MLKFLRIVIVIVIVTERNDIFQSPEEIPLAKIAKGAGGAQWKGERGKW